VARRQSGSALSSRVAGCEAEEIERVPRVPFVSPLARAPTGSSVLRRGYLAKGKLKRSGDSVQGWVSDVRLVDSSCGVAGVGGASGFDEEEVGFHIRAGAVLDAFWHNENLTRVQCDRAVGQVDGQLA
jgi:hypothetical protein